MLWKCMDGLLFCESWWDLWAASYDAPEWDAKEKKSTARGRLALFSYRKQAARILYSFE